jgi:hypothetical protein
MPKINGAKLYVAAAFGIATAMRMTIGDAPLSAADQQTAGWVLNGICTGLGIILGPELIDGVKAVLSKLSGNGASE